MNAVISTAAVPAQEVSNGLINSFVQYVDRGEKTTRTYLTNLRQFVAWMRYEGISAPEREDIIKYREWLLSEHEAIEMDNSIPSGWKYRVDHIGNPQLITCKPNTVKQYLQSVKQLFSWAAAEGKYPNIAANIHAPKIRDAHRKDCLTVQDVQTIERDIIERAQEKKASAESAMKDSEGKQQRSDEQGKRLYAIYLLAVNAGLRTVEISRANIRDLEVKGGKATLYIWGKGHSEPDQKKPIAPEVYEAIKDYLDSRIDNPTKLSPLFVSTGNRSGGKRIAPTTISTMLKRAMQSAGFDSERLTAHSLRHTAGQNVMEITGDNIYQTQMYMRHSNPKTTELYLDNEATQQDEALAQRLYDHFHGRQDTAASSAQDRIHAATQSMSIEQLEQLARIADAITGRAS